MATASCHEVPAPALATASGAAGLGCSPAREKMRELSMTLPAGSLEPPIIFFSCFSVPSARLGSARTGCSGCACGCSACMCAASTSSLEKRFWQTKHTEFMSYKRNAK